MDLHSLISFCHFSVRLSVSQAVYCISVFVSKNGRSSSLPRKQLNWPPSTSQEQLSSSPCSQPCSRQSPEVFRAGCVSAHRTGVSCLAWPQTRVQCPKGVPSWVSKGSPSWPRAVLSDVLSWTPSHSPLPHCCPRSPGRAVCWRRHGQPGRVPEPGAGPALGSVALGRGTQQHLPWLPTCPGHSSVHLMCVPTQNQHRVHAQHSSLLNDCQSSPQ